MEYLDDFLLADPTVVVFGIGFRDVGYLQYEANETPTCTIIDEKDFGIYELFLSIHAHFRHDKMSGISLYLFIT